MTEEFRQELNKQTLELLAQLMEEKKGCLVCAIVKQANVDHYECMLGSGVGPQEFVHALAQIMPGIQKWDNMTKNN